LTALEKYRDRSVCFHHGFWGLAIFATWGVLLTIAKRLIFDFLRPRVAARDEPILSTNFLDALSPALSLIIWIVDLPIVTRLLAVSSRWERDITICLDAGTVIALIVFFDRWTPALVQRLAEGSRIVTAESSLIRGITRASILVLGGLMLLDTLGISISPLLASLGIGSVAVALALQDTLANLFAGIYIATDKPLAPGDFVRLDNGQEGYMARLGWRSSHIRMSQGGSVVVPNQRLATSVLTNFSLPNGAIAQLIELSVSADSDLDRVEAITLDVANEVLSMVHTAEQQSEPKIHFQALNGKAAKFTVANQARSEPVTIRHEFIKRICGRYEREKIALL